MGWLMCRKHPDVIEQGKLVDMSDLAANPVISVQRKFYVPLVALIWAAFPTLTPYYMWGEGLWEAWFVCVMFRYVLILNITWCVNSAAHYWGYKPYNKTINPVECNIRHVMFGEGFHNYHHTFPWDYKASEYGPLDGFNPATIFINTMAVLGQAYDLRQPSADMIGDRHDDTVSRRAGESATGVLSLQLVCVSAYGVFTAGWPERIRRFRRSELPPAKSKSKRIGNSCAPIRPSLYTTPVTAAIPETTGQVSYKYI
ncbi:unnamed protein product [Medioppia subpectinata]|uniref:Uncharacterized protein n=1 Tax=Medioppia subpectinata TaxID=1979941 RepID=A0A7R9KXE4_9ACAR|nr:unnamed protein product [Medioppia subpectinata]CAG2111268.1 unnamed protein product [Medioppia subpectinata]